VNKLRTKQEFVPDLSLVAVSEGKIVGHILLYPLEIVSDDSATTTLTLAPLAVHPDVQRRGIGSRLVEAGLKKAKELGFDSVIIVGYPAYYERFGFRRASGWGLRLPFDAPDDAFLAIELKPKSLEAVRGVVQFPTGYLECP
jgi:putative acetyltransferase